MFAGSTKSAVVAPSVKPSVTLAAFTELSLNILPNGVRTVNDAFEEFTHTEVITGYQVR